MRHRNAHHFIFSPKYRRDILQGEMVAEITRHLNHIAQYHDIDVLALSIQPDHVHIFLDMPRKLSPAYAVQQVKWFTSIWTRKRYPEVVNEKSLWQRRYYSRSIGGDSKQVKKYIENQGIALSS
jgi:putative transposase